MGVGHIEVAMGARRGVCNIIIFWGVDILGRIVLCVSCRIWGWDRLRKAFGLESLWVESISVVWIVHSRNGGQRHGGCAVVSMIGRRHVIGGSDSGHGRVGG